MRVFIFLLFMALTGMACKNDTGAKKSNDSKTSTTNLENAQFSLGGTWLNRQNLADKLTFSGKGTMGQTRLEFSVDHTIKSKTTWDRKGDQLTMISVKEFYRIDNGHADLDLFERDTTICTIKWDGARAFKLTYPANSGRGTVIYDLE